MTTRPIDRFLAELRAFAKLNDLKAVHEPANEFEECLNDWYELQQLQEAVKQAMDGINKEERILLLPTPWPKNDFEAEGCLLYADVRQDRGAQ